MRNNSYRLRNTISNERLFHQTITLRSATSSIKDEPKDKPSLTLSDSCIKKLKEISERENTKYLRVTVDGGGCSGFQYIFNLEDKINEDDIVIGENGSKVIIDTISLDYCAGSTVDYHTELIKSGFRIVGNPKAEQGCGCGASFSLKLD